MPLKCPQCKALEIDASTPKTVYACGSKDYDQRPGTFEQSDKCKITCLEAKVEKLEKLAKILEPLAPIVRKLLYKFDSFA